MQVPMTVGQHVNVGQVIAVLNTQTLTEELSTARAAMESARAAYGASQISYTAAKDSVARRTKGVQSGLITAEELAKAEFDLQRSAAEVAQSKALLRQQETLIAALQTKLSKAQIRSPIEGDITRKYVELGQKVEQDEAIIRIVGKGSTTLRFAIPLAEKTLLQSGTALTLACEVGQELVAREAKVTYVAPEIDPVAKVVIAEGVLDAASDAKAVASAKAIGSQPTLPPGTVCRIRVAEPVAADAVPNSAL